jgi:hypothetical protein
MSKFTHLASACAVLAFCAASVASANATVYTSNGNIADFLNGSFATFSDFTSGDVSSPFTPTKSGVEAVGNRVYGGTATGAGLPTTPGENFILATFSSPTSHIEIIPNIDHPEPAYDGYQYSIYGWDGSTFVPLYDTLTVAGASPPFTIGSFTGTAPSLVNNVETPSASNPNGAPGYEAFFTFGSAYSVYALGPSTEAFSSGNTDQEFSAVLTGVVPEPSTWAMMLLGFVGLGFAGRRASRGSLALNA